MLELLKSPKNVLLAGLALAGLAALYAMFSAPDGEDWDDFVRSHNCVSVGKQLGSNQGGWRCADGKIYYRWRQQK